MGKKIDGFVLSALAACGFYLFFRLVFGGGVLSFALATLSFAVLMRTIKLLQRIISRFPWLNRRRLRGLASGVVMELALLPEKEAQAAVEKLLNKCYPGEYAVRLVQNHPGLNLKEAEVFEIWKKNRDAEKLAICASCRADSACRAFASSLKNPKTAIVDSEDLCRMIAEHPDDYPLEHSAPQRTGLRLKHIASMIFNRKNIIRNLTLALSMAALYLFSGNIWYLLAACALVFISLASVHRPARPARLF